MTFDIDPDSEGCDDPVDAICPYCKERQNGWEATEFSRECDEEECVCERCGGTYMLWYERPTTYFTRPVAAPPTHQMPIK